MEDVVAGPRTVRARIPPSVWLWLRFESMTNTENSTCIR